MEGSERASFCPAGSRIHAASRTSTTGALIVKRGGAVPLVLRVGKLLLVVVVALSLLLVVVVVTMAVLVVAVALSLAVVALLLLLPQLWSAGGEHSSVSATSCSFKR